MKIEPFKMEVTPEQSRQVQEIVFRNGGEWASGDKTEQNTQYPFLVYDKDNELRFGDKGPNSSYDNRPEPQITFADFMSRYGGEPHPTQFDNMRKIVTIAEDAHKNGDSELSGILLDALSDYIIHNRPE